MSFCPKCGASLDNARFFCPACGAKVNTAAPAETTPTVAAPVASAPRMPQTPPAFSPDPVPTAQPTAPAPVFQQPAPAPVFQQPAPAAVYPAAPVSLAQTGGDENPANNLIRKFAKSPLYLAGIISFTLGVIFSAILLIVSVPGFRDMADVIRNYVSDKIGKNTGEIVTNIETSLLITSFLSLLPLVLLIAGLWILFVSAFNREDPQLKPTGFTVLKAGHIVQLFFFCAAISLCIVLLLGAVILLFISPSIIKDLEYNIGDLSRLAKESEILDSILSPVLDVLEDGEDLSAAFLPRLSVALAGSVFVSVIGIVFLAKSMSSITTAKRALHSFKETDTVSIYVAVIAFLLAVAAVVLLCLNTENVIFLLTSAFFAISCACFGALILLYNNSVRKILPAD